MPIDLPSGPKLSAPSLLWGLETTRASKRCQDIVKRTQRHMLVKMLGRKRRHVDNTLEPWLEYHIRFCREAKLAIAATSAPHHAIKQLQAEKRSFAGHVVRFGADHREEHLVKHIVTWRNTFWLYHERKHILKGTSFFHPSEGR